MGMIGRAQNVLPLAAEAANCIKRALPRVHAVELEGMGHMVPVTHPEIFGAMVSRFLDRHRPFHLADVSGVFPKPQGAAPAAG
jgi:pimeloyl-ACP methyl ester carboxylesterase